MKRLLIWLHRRRLSAVARPLFASVLAAETCAATPLVDGDLDPSFGGNGKVTTSFTGSGEARALAIQLDGKVVVAGYAGQDFALARYNSDGSLDASFGTGGKVTTNFGGDDYGRAVALQADGKTVVAGQVFVSGQSYNLGLARYNADGSLDASFGTAGKVTTDFNGGTDAGNAVAIQTDGKILVAGEAVQSDFGLVRYNTNGSLDTSFGTGGKVRTDFNGGPDAGNAVAIQADGKILVAGQVFISAQGYYNFGLVRYHTDGSLDAGFGTGGKAFTDFTGATDFGNGVAIQSDGKIVVAGRAYVSPNEFGLVRYNSDGSPDTTFAGDGKVTTGFGGVAASGNAVAIQTDAKILVTGQTCVTFESCSFGLVRYIATSAPTDAGSFDAPRRTGLVTSHPNPFRPWTQITFDLARTGPVELSIYDVHGRRVRGLVEPATWSAGRHSRAWDGNDDRGLPVAPGVYFARLRTAEGVDVSRLVRAR